MRKFSRKHISVSIFCLSGSTNQPVAVEGYSCERSWISPHSKLYYMPHQELGCVVLAKTTLVLPIMLLSDTITKLPQKNTLQYALFVTIAFNFGIMRLISNSAKTRERTLVSF